MNSKNLRRLWSTTTLRSLAIFLILIVLFWAVASIIINLTQDYPINASRDWLSILADFGQLLGGIAVAGLIIEVYRYLKTEREETMRRVPKIHISRTIPLSNENNADGTYTLMEAERPDTLDIGDQYREMWIEMGSPKKDGTDLFLKIEIQNNQAHTEANVEEFKLKILLTYSGANARQNSTTKTFWCPIDNMSLQIGKKTFLFVRCGMLTDAKMINVEGKIVDYKCITAKRDEYYGKALGFREINIPFQPLHTNLPPKPTEQA